MLSLLVLCAPACALLGESTPSDGYRLPPPDVVALLDAAPTPDVDISPDAKWMLLVERPAMPSIADVTRAWVGLAGVRVDLVRNAPQQISFSTGIVVRSLAGGDERRVELPKDARIGSVSWAPTSDRFALTLVREDGVDLYTCKTNASKPVRVATNLNGVLGSSFEWSGDGKELLVKLVARERAALPQRSATPTGPVVQESSGRSTPLRTYQDLLGDAHDESVFEHCAHAQLAFVDADSGASKPLGASGMFAGVDQSPDGEHVIVTRLHRPFSFVLPYYLFPQAIEVWNRAGKLERTIIDAPLGDDIPMEGVRTGPRSVQWHATEPATLYWAEAQDGGDPKRKAEVRDRWFALAAPFAGDAKPLFTLAQRAQGLRWFADPSLVIASEYDRDRRWTKSMVFDLAHLDAAPKIVDDRSVNDRYGDPGTFVSQVGVYGRRIVRVDGEYTYRSGAGASAEGARPFLDRYSLETAQSERLWQCASGTYETLAAIVRSNAQDKPVVVTSFESPTDVPNVFLRDLQKGDKTALTSFPDPQPALRGVRQELVKYERKDGVDLSATLYLPADWKEGTLLPLVVWAYPNEFTDERTAGQVSGSPARFVRVRGPSQLLFVTQGYAVLDNASMPVVGDPETVNDTFLEQIVMNAQAAIDHAVERGVADRRRVGVGGHSYGAFMTANLLAHCDLFQAGIARSGAYNRTLTPFGFQSERRTLWEAPDAYVKLSPFLNANKLDEPVLFIHGEKDANQGTFPMQSERMYQAVKGNGGTTRLVVLPGESHGYQARESVLHATAEMFEWFDRHVKHAAEPGVVPASAAGGR